MDRTPVITSPELLPQKLSKRSQAETGIPKITRQKIRVLEPPVRNKSKCLKEIEVYWVSAVSPLAILHAMGAYEYLMLTHSVSSQRLVT